jgi:hypothetical protein
VQYIITSWRNHFAKTVAMKFNCFFLMPFLDDFPSYLRDELDSMYESGVGELFDISEARVALQNKKVELVAECEANSKLQRRFDLINVQLRSGLKGTSASSTTDEEKFDENAEFQDGGREWGGDSSLDTQNDFNSIDVTNESTDRSTSASSSAPASNTKKGKKRPGSGMMKKKSKSQDSQTSVSASIKAFEDLDYDVVSIASYCNTLLHSNIFYRRKLILFHDV